MIPRNRHLVCIVMVLSMGLGWSQSQSAIAQQDVQPGFFQKTIDGAQSKMVKVYGAGAGRVEGFATGIVVSNDGRMTISSNSAGA